MGNAQLVTNVYDAFGHGDMPAVLAAFAPNIEWRQAESNPYQPSGAPWIGGKAVVENLFTKLAAEWDGFTVTPGAFHDAGDTVVVEGRYTGSFKGTGRRIDAQFCHIWKARDGKLVSFQQFTDTAQLQNAMGAQ
jgi:ketosteroid isomerase-like protein